MNSEAETENNLSELSTTRGNSEDGEPCNEDPVLDMADGNQLWTLFFKGFLSPPHLNTIFRLWFRLCERVKKALNTSWFASPTAFLGEFWHCCSCWLLVDKSPWVTGGLCQLEGKSLTANKCSLTHRRHSMSHCVQACVSELQSFIYCSVIYFFYLSRFPQKMCPFQNWEWTLAHMHRPSNLLLAVKKCFDSTKLNWTQEVN